MKPTIQDILAKIKRINYLAHADPKTQVIQIRVNKDTQLSAEEKKTIINHIKSLLSATTEVSEFMPGEPVMTVYIKIPEVEDPEPLKALIGDFYKTP